MYSFQKKYRTIKNLNRFQTTESYISQYKRTKLKFIGKTYIKAQDTDQLKANKI